MLTDTMVANFATLAGPTFTWEGVRGTSRPGSDVRTELRDDLLSRQGGICPVCGTDDAASGAWEFNHVVARGNAIKGFLPGNVFAGHSACNARTKPILDDKGNLISGIAILTVDYFVRADLIPLEWTPFPVLRERRKAAKRAA